MSKSIILKRNNGDAAKRGQLNGLGPIKLVEYQNGAALGAMSNDLGTVDYVLATGGHGNFVGKKPTQFNGADIDNFRKWIGDLKCNAKAIILDTCFSSALAGSFLKFLPNGGCVVCAHGSGEGWATGFSTANGAKTVGEVLSDVVANFKSLVGASSIGLVIKKPTQTLLYTANSGTARRATLDTKEAFEMDHDSEVELKELDLYLRMDGISVTPTESDDLALLLKSQLKMTIA